MGVFVICGFWSVCGIWSGGIWSVGGVWRCYDGECCVVMFVVFFM